MTVNPILCNTDHGDPIRLGSRWREDDPRSQDRVVVVNDYDRVTDRVQIKGATGRLTWAKRTRFSRAGGYVELT